jgi:hypothetical protein
VKKRALMIPVNRDLAERLGEIPALLMTQLAYWEPKASEVDEAGRVWVFKTYDEWKDEIKSVSKRTIMRAVSKVRMMGLVEVSRRRANRWRQTNFFRIEWDRVRELGIPLCAPGCRAGARQDGPIKAKSTGQHARSGSQAPPPPAETTVPAPPQNPPQSAEQAATRQEGARGDPPRPDISYRRKMAILRTPLPAADGQPVMIVERVARWLASKCSFGRIYDVIHELLRRKRKDQNPAAVAVYLLKDPNAWVNPHLLWDRQREEARQKMTHAITEAKEQAAVEREAEQANAANADEWKKLLPDEQDRLYEQVLALPDYLMTPTQKAIIRSNGGKTDGVAKLYAMKIRRGQICLSDASAELLEQESINGRRDGQQR